MEFVRLNRRSLVFLPLVRLFGADRPFTAELWEAIRAIYARTLAHPYLAGLADGTLAPRKFRFYLEQDALYLGAYSRCLNLLAAKAPREDWGLTLATHALDAIKTERQFHESVLKGAPRAVEMSPSNYAYTSHLLATVHHCSFAEGLAAMLPCYWIYREVGRELIRRGSKNADYQRWIQQYAADDYSKSVDEVLAMMNAEAPRLDAQDRERLKRLFVISSRYEYMFWDMAWREEAWP